MLFHKKIVSLPSPDRTNQGMGSKFKCHDYSTIVDVDVYKGGYDNYYCRVFYTTPGDSTQSENKQVTLLCVYETNFIDSEKNYDDNNPFEKKPPTVVIDDKYRFLKSVKIGMNSSSVKTMLFIYISEELSIPEIRDTKIDKIVSFC